MSFLKDKQSRYFFFFIITLIIFMLGFGAVLTIIETQAAKKMLITHDSAIISSLVEQGIQTDVIASAVSNTKVNAQGESLLIKLGYTEKTAVRFIPAVSGFETSTFCYVFVGMLFSAAVLLALCISFLEKRQQMYSQATKTVLSFSNGDFSKHLPRSDEGALYKLFASVDNLASALQAKSESEYKAKEFLKDTISDISHQLKTPLAALNMYNEIMLDEPNNTETVIEFSQKTTLSLRRMEELIQSLLKITRLDVGSIEFEKSQYLVSEIIEHAVGELTTRAAREDKEIVIGQTDEQVFCDFQWTSEAVENIVKNALDYTSAGGQIHISCESSLAMVRICVSDDGAGIAPEDIHHIFKRFYRSRKPKDTQGVGLGLALAKAIVEGQGGIISVQSMQGCGTTFTLSFLTEL
ncbi:MAG: HAMP domain-containing sensor histidine kinase [Candidatus Metalachnospira sp.]|nr:HAMP domain-containing sensor histidine kinase [Candidatus Metalachnospira sp.]